MNKGIGTIIAVAAWASTAAADPVLPIEPTARTPVTGALGIGYYTSGTERVAYRGLLGTTHTIERESAGVVLSTSYGERTVGLEGPSLEADDVGADVAPATDTDRGASRTRKATYATLWLQVPTDSRSTLSGTSPLDGAELGGGSLTLGAAGVSRMGAFGSYAFVSSTAIDDSVSFEADGRDASGTLEGVEYSLGLGLSGTIADRLTLSAGFRQTFSALEFERARDAGTAQFPASLTATDTVSRRKRTAVLVGATLRLFDGLFLDARASYRDEPSVSLAVSVGF